MTKYAKAREIISYKIGKGKKQCRKALKSNFLLLILCWTVTGIVAFASYGVYVFLDFAGAFLGLTTDFAGAVAGLLAFLPLLVGNINVCSNIMKGRKADIYTLFDNFFNFKKFWMWIAAFVIALSPGWIFTLISAHIARYTEVFFLALEGTSLYFASAFFEVITLILLFINLCKSLYFLSLFDLSQSEREFFEKAEYKYSKKKKYFKKYILSHFHFVIILFFARFLPLYGTALVYVFVLGYLALALTSFSGGFGIKFKKYKFGRTERKI